MRSNESLAGLSRLKRLDQATLSTRFTVRDAVTKGQLYDIEFNDAFVERQCSRHALGQPLAVNSGLPLSVDNDNGACEAFAVASLLCHVCPRPRRRRHSALKHRRPSLFLRRAFIQYGARPRVHRGEREIIAPG